MAYTLIINPGSTSRKYALYSGVDCVYNVVYEDTGNGYRMAATRDGICETDKAVNEGEYTDSLEHLLAYFDTIKLVDRQTPITAIGIRVVAPLRLTRRHSRIDAPYIAALARHVVYAPLHIPPLLDEIRACQQHLPQAALIGVSDSAFHSTMPEAARTISLAERDREAGEIERYGYHGLSIASVVRRLPQFLPSVPRRLIVCHVGGGISVTALKDGESIATSMGYSPASGLAMGGRGGDIEADAFAALLIEHELEPDELFNYLYEQAGFYGVAGVRDLRLLLERANGGDTNAKAAVAMLQHQLRGWIGRQAAALNGVDAVVMTATAAVRNPAVRNVALQELDGLGIVLDDARNEALVGKEGVISSNQSATTVLVMQTDEMGEMARVIMDVVKHG